MVEIGKFNELKLLYFCEKGAMLEGETYGEILLPRQYLRNWMKEGEKVRVFVYPDTKDRLVGTREKPYAIVGEFAFLQVELVNEKGAYLDWGVARKLFVPMREQRARMHEDGVYLVYIAYNEKKGRIYGTAKYDQFIDKHNPELNVGDEVEILVAAQTDLGYKCIINNRYIGMVYANEVVENMELGEITKAYVKRIRDDFKIDLSLLKIGYAKVEDFSEKLLQTLCQRGGFLAMNDNSSAESILEMFGVSKKTFKKAVGDLYRRHLINILEEGISLIEE